MKVKITLSGPSWTKTDALAEIIRSLGSKAVVSGDVVVVDEFDERKVTSILNSKSVTYSRSS